MNSFTIILSVLILFGALSISESRHNSNDGHYQMSYRKRDWVPVQRRTAPKAEPEECEEEKVKPTVPTQPPPTTTTTKAPTTFNACLGGTPCQNGGTCQPSGISLFCLCPPMFYGPHCENRGAGTDLSSVDKIISGVTPISDFTVEKVLSRNNWKDAVAVVDVTGSMRICAASLYKWITTTNGKRDSIKYYVFFNDGDNKPDNTKIIGSTGGIYGVGNTDLNTVLATMKTAIKNGGGGDLPENDVEGLIAGIKQCPTCTNVIHIADNQATPRDLILLNQVTKPVKVIVCELKGTPLNQNLINIALKTGGSIHTLDQDITNLSTIPEGGTITIGKTNYKKTAAGFVKV